VSVLIRELSKAYGFLWALKDVSLEFREGDCVALLGPNGAGKSTLLHHLTSMLRPTMGEITINGERLQHGNSGLRSLIGFISPDAHLYDKLTAQENLQFFVSLYGKRKSFEDIRNALDHVSLARWADEYVSVLSHGMKCRLAIAKWLLLEPKLLLLDEPYGVLDGQGVNLLENFLRKICQSGGIVVMATHNVQRILTLCSRAVILKQGKVIFDEPRREPWTSFQDAFAEFLPREDPWKA
jgi:heme ABC exporter ATP-binding subunit CcmA